MGNIKTFFDSMLHTQIINSIIIVILSVIIYKTITYFLEKSEKNNRFNILSEKKRKTYLKHFKSLCRYIFIVVTILILLQINGINVSSILAGVGILGVILGLAIQDWLKDIIRGSSILSDNYFSVGDVVKYKNIEGKVLVVGLKTTKIQDLITRNVMSIANRNIEEIELVSNLVHISVPIPYETTVEKAEKTVGDIISAINKNDNVDACTYKGVNDLADSSIKYLIEISCNPAYKVQVKRDALRSVLLEMANNGISVPFTQIDIHEK